MAATSSRRWPVENRESDDAAVIIIAQALPDGFSSGIGDDVIPVEISSVALLVPMTGLMSTRPSPIAQVNRADREARARFDAKGPFSFSDLAKPCGNVSPG